VVASYLFGEFSKLSEADPKALETARVGSHLVPIGEASLVCVGFE
jgi:hypothetical protein